MILKDLIASCHDCQEKMKGDLDLDAIAVDTYFIAQVVGSLIQLCSDHHDRNRTWWGQAGVPQHSEFNVILKDQTIGTLAAISSASAVACLTITDHETAQKFNQMVQESSDEWRRQSAVPS